MVGAAHVAPRARVPVLVLMFERVRDQLAVARHLHRCRYLHLGRIQVHVGVDTCKQSRCYFLSCGEAEEELLVFNCSIQRPLKWGQTGEGIKFQNYHFMRE